MQSGNLMPKDDLKDAIKRLLDERLTETYHRSSLVTDLTKPNLVKKKSYAEIKNAGDPIDNAEKLNQIILIHDRDIVTRAMAEIILEGHVRYKFEERISDENAFIIYEEALTLTRTIKLERDIELFKKLNLISKGIAIEEPKNNLERICNILISLKNNKNKIAHKGLRKYVDTVDNDKKQECIKLAIHALEELIWGDITAKRIIIALQKLNLSKNANSQLTGFFSKPGKTHSVITEAYSALYHILNNIKGEELKNYFSPTI